MEDLDGRMILKRMCKLVPQVGKKKNKSVEVSSVSGFWEFPQKGAERGSVLGVEMESSLFGGQ